MSSFNLVCMVLLMKGDEAYYAGSEEELSSWLFCCLRDGLVSELTSTGLITRLGYWVY